MPLVAKKYPLLTDALRTYKLNGYLKAIEKWHENVLAATDDKVKAMCVFIKQLNIQLAINVRKHTTE